MRAPKEFVAPLELKFRLQNATNGLQRLVYSSVLEEARRLLPTLQQVYISARELPGCRGLLACTAM